MPTLERQSYLTGLYTELDMQFERYAELLTRYCELQGQIEMAERAVMLSRDHLLASAEIDDIKHGDMPDTWSLTLGLARFVGARAGDAVLTVLRELGTASTDALLAALNEGGFRFRTTNPMREIHAAMLQHRQVVVRDREADTWTYLEPKQQIIEPKRGARN